MERDDIPSEATDERDELVQVRGAEVAQSGAEDDAAEAEEVLLPLDEHALLAAALEDAVLHYAHGGEQLQRDGQQDGERVEELDLDAPM